MAKKLSPVEEAKLRAILADPVEWAKAFVVSNDAASKKYGPWVARDYQQEMLRDPSLKKVYRCGRRCLPEWIQIVDPYSGELKTVGQLFKEQVANVAAMDPEDYSIKKQQNCPVSYNGVKEVYKVVLESGAEIDATSNHPLYTSSGWKEIGELKPGDYVAVPTKLDIWGDTDISDEDIKKLANSIEDTTDAVIPKEIFTASKKSISLFLSHLYFTNGWMSATEIGHRAKSESIVRAAAHLLLRFGILTSVYKQQETWNILINDKQSFFTFTDEIGINGRENIVKECKEAALKKDSFKDTKNSIKGQIMWREIKSIIPIGEYPTYDLTVPEYHNFIANDIITHNTGKSETMIIEGLHKAYTHKNFRILYITPYENQVNLIFMRMREIIHDSPLIKNEIVRMKNSPYMIEFKNGSSIMGFTTGASSGSGAASIRGQRADWIFLDELDYMGEQDYSTVAMIAGERADIGMTCSSTPTGKRGTFYQMCTDKRPTSQGGWGFTEHYHPSMHNPNWCQQMEDEFRAELTSAQYDHEILAIFGTEETGVFNKEKLDMAQRRLNYTYDTLTEAQLRAISQENGTMPDEYFYDEINVAPHNIFRCVGVDWDKFQASSSIVVLDYNVQMQSFQVIKRIEVPRSEYTLDNAVNWVVRVNQIFRPAWIFCDRGYGERLL